MAMRHNDIDYHVKPSEIFSEKWNTKLVNQYLDMVEDGIKIKSSPFWDNNINYRKGNLIFEYTKEEINEIYKCATDVVYFANTYCHVMTDEGVKPINLRDYQIPILKDFTDPKKRFHMLLSSRQIGKCTVYLTEINDINGERKYIGEIYYKELSKIRKLTILEKIKIKLYSFLKFL